MDNKEMDNKEMDNKEMDNKEMDNKEMDNKEINHHIQKVFFQVGSIINEYMPELAMHTIEHQLLTLNQF
jgi:predicted secreted protein